MEDHIGRNVCVYGRHHRHRVDGWKEGTVVAPHQLHPSSPSLPFPFFHLQQPSRNGPWQRQRSGGGVAQQKALSLSRLWGICCSITSTLGPLSL